MLPLTCSITWLGLCLQNATGWVNRTVYYVDAQLEQVTLKQGQQYYVVVQGINDAGVQLATTLSSEAILVSSQVPAFR